MNKFIDMWLLVHTWMLTSHDVLSPNWGPAAAQLLKMKDLCLRTPWSACFLALHENIRRIHPWLSCRQCILRLDHDRFSLIESGTQPPQTHSGGIKIIVQPFCAHGGFSWPWLRLIIVHTFPWQMRTLRDLERSTPCPGRLSQRSCSHSSRISSRLEILFSITT